VKREELSAEARRILSLFEGRSIGENDIAKEAQGRPFLPDCGPVDFNIAHSGALAAVSYLRGENLRTGCDVERIRPRARAREIAEEFFSAAERKYLFHQGKFDEVRFYEIWTLKECFLKLRGLSVFDMAGCPSFIGAKDEFAFDAAVSPLSFRVYELSDGADERYILAAAVEGTEQERPIIRWFSQSFLACRNIAEIKAALNPAETVRPKM
jgi:4'-phosphopantetheinyl transferase